MYSLVMLVAMTAGPDVPQDFKCPVTPSNYGNSFWSKHCFFECCAPARYGWVNCWTKGFGYYPTAGCGCCTASSGHPFFLPNPCACGACGSGYGGGYGGGGKGCCFCGYDWGIGHTPAYYTSVLGCPAHLSGPPYACGTNCQPCCTTQFAFDTGLAGHTHGAGYAGFGGYGNFGFYGGVPMGHKPGTFDLPPFPRPDYQNLPTSPSGPAPMPPIPSGGTPPAPMPPGPDAGAPKMPEPPPPPPDAKKDGSKKDDSKKDDGKDDGKKSRLGLDRPAPATVILSVPAAAAVTVDGQPLTGTGRERSFRTPDLAPDREYEYTVRAVIVVGGREEVETQQVRVSAGRISRASFEELFTRADGSSPTTPVGYRGGR